jgi:hypothetical protein
MNHFVLLPSYSKKRVRSGPIIDGFVQPRRDTIQRDRHAFDCVDVDELGSEELDPINDLFDLSDLLGDCRLRRGALADDG